MVNMCADVNCTALTTGERVVVLDGVATAVLDIRTSGGADPNGIDLLDTVVFDNNYIPYEITVDQFLKERSPNPKNYSEFLDYLVRSARAFDRPYAISKSLDTYLKSLGVTYTPPTEK